MDVSKNIRDIRIQQGLKQKDIYLFLNVDKSVYSKIETGGREATVNELIKISKLFNMTVDEIINYEGDIPSNVILEDKTAIEQNQLFNELDEEDRQTVLKIVDKMLTTKKFNEFFEKNLKTKKATN